MNNENLIIDSVNQAIRKLEKAGIADAKIDAWLLAEFVFNIKRQDYFLNRNIETSHENKVKYLNLVDKRCANIPLQHLTNVQEFMGLKFIVNGNVLIPRQDTELLVEKTIDLVKNNPYSENIKILDMCTGSGCIAIALSKLIDNVKIVAADLSQKALEVARLNAKHLEAEVEFVESDLFENVTGRFDIIVSNPPYIEKKVIPTLMEEVKNHEPMIALDGGKDGLDFYKKIAEQSYKYLKTNGMILFEIGYNQGESVPEILREYNYEDIVVYKDLSGNDRVVYARKGE